jgi:hypothetical protein
VSILLAEAYRQPLSDAVGIIVAFVLLGAGSLAIFFDVGGVASDVARQVAARKRNDLKDLQMGRMPTWFADLDSLRRWHRSFGMLCFLTCCGVLVLEIVGLALHGVR